jgi:hypothetical protein
MGLWNQPAEDTKTVVYIDAVYASDNDTKKPWHGYIGNAWESIAI